VGGRLDPAVARVRLEVRAALTALTGAVPGGANTGASGGATGGLVLVGFSGGADSLALLAATCFEAPGTGLCAGAVIVDHGMQPGSADVAARAAAQAAGLGAAPVRVERVCVGTRGGPEAAARTVRHAALRRVADELGAQCVLLAHTRDDQAETVLLGLARGSGARSLAGMRPVTGRVRRPLLALTRAETRAACAAEHLSWWDDPHNADDAHARARVRHRLLPALEQELGPGIRDALARSADLLRADADALDALAAGLLETARAAPAGGLTGALSDAPGQWSESDVRLQVDVLVAAPAALRHRVLRSAAIAAGCPAGDLAAVHVVAVDRLLTAWHGQRGVDLPGKVRASRSGGSLRLAPRPVTG